MKENGVYQLRYVVDNNQVGPGVSEAEVSFIINSTELTNSAHTQKKHTIQEQMNLFFLSAKSNSLRSGSCSC